MDLLNWTLGQLHPQTGMMLTALQGFRAALDMRQDGNPGTPREGVRAKMHRHNPVTRVYVKSNRYMPDLGR
ncbi:TPA: hypothetical protein ACH3X1_004159 [Trebouxia sp. C0004]